MSDFCDSECVITPISPMEETKRQALGIRTAQNFLESNRVGINDVASKNYCLFGDYWNHSGGSMLKALVSHKVWKTYTKIAIHRSPRDRLISQYFYTTRHDTTAQRPSFSDWYGDNKHNVLENYFIAPLTGDYRCDLVLNYETLDNDIRSSGVLPDEFLALLKKLSFKAGFRDKNSRDIDAFYAREGVDPAEVDQIIKAHLS